MEANDMLVALTADVVAAYVGNNALAVSDIPALISEVHGALARTMTQADEAPAAAALTPAVAVENSITDDFIVCLEDGKRFKSLKRHLMTTYGMTPEEYRQRWNLPADYPMVPPSYAAARWRLAKQMGLGRKPSAAPSLVN